MKYANERHKDGKEHLSDKPMQPPLGYRRTPTLSEQIRQQVLAAKLEDLERLEETEEEADDFEIGDDFEPTSHHENEGAPTIKQLRARAEEINNEIKRQNLEKVKAELEARHKEMAQRNQSSKTPTPQVSGQPE